MVIGLFKLVEVAQLGHAVVAQHAIHATIEDADILIRTTKLVEAAVSQPNCARVHFAAVRAPHAFNAALIVAQRLLGKWPSVHTAQHACKDTVVNT